MDPSNRFSSAFDISTHLDADIRLWVPTDRETFSDTVRFPRCFSNTRTFSMATHPLLFILNFYVPTMRFCSSHLLLLSISRVAVLWSQSTGPDA